MIEFIIKNRTLFFIVLFYFLFRLINLTLLPIFNDEAIYLDWGFRQTEPGGDIYFSLIDGKQPLLIWIFGIASRIIDDPLVAGRLTSVIIGSTTLIGIFLLCQNLLNKRSALIASAIYIITPIFVFFDRQALMESSLSAVGIWSLYFLHKLVSNNSKNYAIALGIILGIGFFIKTSALIFIFTALILLLYKVIKNKDIVLLKYTSISVLSIILVNLLLIINPIFWESLSQNSRYSLTFIEIIKFPVNTWMNNFVGNIDIVFYFLSPIVLLLSIIGLVLIFKIKPKNLMVVALWIAITLLIETLTVKATSQRYLVSFLPPIIVLITYTLEKIYNKTLKFILIFTIIMISGSLSVFQILKPAENILLFSNISNKSETGYINGFTSGFGVNETINYLKNKSIKEDIFIGVALNAGNPESAIIAYFNNKKNIQSGYMDTQMINIPTDIKCLSMNKKIYFVARDRQLAGFDKYLEEVKRFNKPYDNSSIGIYTLKNNCSGKTLDLNPTI